MRFTMPLPKNLDVRQAGGLLRRVAGECAAWIVVVVVALVMLAPVAAFLIAGAWGVYTYIRTLLMLWRHVQTYQLSDLAPLLDSLDRAGRVALASAGYFALLCALIVLMAGLIGKRWRRLFLFPGLVFTFPSAFAFFFGLRLSLDDFAASYQLSDVMRIALMVYPLLDAIVLAAVLVDISPRRRRVRRSRSSVVAAPLAPVHFDPSGPRANRLREPDAAPTSAAATAPAEMRKAVTGEIPPLPTTESASTLPHDGAPANASGASSPLAHVS